MKKREFSPIIGQFPDREKIKCKDCAYRKKVMFCGEDIGAANSYCEIYTKDLDLVGKPSEILFKNADCEYYTKDHNE